MTEYYHSEYNYSIRLTDEICHSMFPAAFLFSFHLNKMYHMCCSILSITSIIYFLTCHRKALKFSFSLRILFYYQFIACLCLATTVLCFQTHHLIIELLAQGPCDVVLNPFIYAFFNITLLLSECAVTSSLVLSVVERTLASCFLKFHERMPRMFGVYMAVCASIFPLITCYWMFYNITFDYPQMSVISSHPDNAERWTIFFITLFIIYCFTSIYSIYLYRYNKKISSSIHAKILFELSSKYQIGENVTTSRIMWQLTTAQVTIFLIFLISLNFVRYFVPKPRPPVWQVVTEVFYMPPAYCAVMPMLCIYTIKKSETERNSRITSIVSMKSTGSEGWDNYQKMLKNQWA